VIHVTVRDDDTKFTVLNSYVEFFSYNFQARHMVVTRLFLETTWKEKGLNCG
jgi:hypothetical protein